MSECSAVVRLQVVHPVPAFLFSKFFEKLYSKTALRIPISIGAFKIFVKQLSSVSISRKMNKIYILKLGGSTKFENLYAKHPF